MKRIIRKVYQRISTYFEPTSFSYYGTKVYFPKKSFIYKKAGKCGRYEEENIKLILSRISPDSTYFDIGANIGLMAIPILQECKSSIVVSFEPSPNTINYLKHTAQDSSFGDRWIIVDKALGNKITNLEFCISSPELGAYDGFKNTKRMPIEKTIVVPVTTLDTQWKEQGKPKVSFIKIDTEGAEMDVLNGGIECIKSERPDILLEWNARNLSAYGIPIEVLIDFTVENDYLLYSAPYFIPIHNLRELELQMIQTENFLLTPK